MSTTAAVLSASVGVGLGHAILPDHWVPLAVFGRTQRYPLSKIARLSGLAGVAHVLLSIVLGAVIIAVGLQFRSSVQSVQDTIVGGLLLLTGLGFVALELVGHGHRHGPGGHTHGESTHAHHPHDDHDHDLPDRAEHTHTPRSHGRPGDPSASHSHALARHVHGHPGDEQPITRTPGAVGRRRWSRMSTVMVPLGAAASPDLTILPVFLAAAAAGVATAISSIVLFAAATIGTIVTLTLLAGGGGYQLTGEWLERWGNAITAVVLMAIGALVLLGII
ncbi:MAG: hypothetical protein JOZ07_09240 [Solirubrobacterales bacterium]|nr:hypothetical protein [Solirubrobacterales bacterium]